MQVADSQDTIHQMMVAENLELQTRVKVTQKSLIYIANKNKTNQENSVFEMFNENLHLT